jgi:hypothetical protein
MRYEHFSDAQIKSWVAQIDTQGYAVLPDWSSGTELTQLGTLVDNAVAAAGNRYVALTGSQAVAGSALQEWGTCATFLDLCRRVVAMGTGRVPTAPATHQVLRCLVGEEGRRTSMIFHYDSFVLTAIVPVCMPDKTDPGDLLLLPNHRPIRDSYVRNLLDKLVVDNRWSQRYFIKRHARRPQSFTRIRMLPGHMYLFWGYRSLHTNLPADPAAIRATAVFHYQNVHGGSSLAGRLRGLLAKRKLQADPA